MGEGSCMCKGWFHMACSSRQAIAREVSPAWTLSLASAPRAFQVGCLIIGGEFF